MLHSIELRDSARYLVHVSGISPFAAQYWTAIHSVRMYWPLLLLLPFPDAPEIELLKVNQCAFIFEFYFVVVDVFVCMRFVSFLNFRIKCT